MSPAPISPLSSSAPKQSAFLFMFAQLRHLMLKNWRLYRRHYLSTLVQLLVVPLLIMVVLYVIQSKTNSIVNTKITKPPVRTVEPVPMCSRAYRSSLPCITMMFTNATDPTVQKIMQTFQERNLNRGGPSALTIDSSWTPSLSQLPSSDLGIVGVQDDRFVYQFVQANPNVTAWAVSFDVSPSPFNASVTNYQYQLWYNYTTTLRPFPAKGAPPYVPAPREPMNDEIVRVMRAMDEAILVAVTGVSTVELNVGLKDLPEVSEDSIYKCPRNPDQVFTSIGPVFLFVPMTVIFFTTINTVVAEKEKGLKDYMQMSGLNPVVFWGSHFLTGVLMALGNALWTVCMGLAFQLSFFAKSAFGVTFFMFFLFGVASVAFGLVISSIFTKVRSAVGFGFFITIIGVVYIAVGQQVTYIWYTDSSDPTTTDLSPGWKTLMFFPFFNFNKLFRDISPYTVKSFKFTKNSCTLVEATSFQWSNLYDPPIMGGGPFDPRTTEFIPVPNQSLWFFVMNTVVFLFLTWYLDKTLPNENGLRAHPLFFLFPSYYGFQDPQWFLKFMLVQSSSEQHLPQKSKPLPSEDSDVTTSRTETKALEATVRAVNSDVGLVISGLHKRYGSLFRSLVVGIYKLFGASLDNAEEKAEGWSKSKVAINELSLYVKKGELLSLLGTNGAGKTSTMKILYGLSRQDSGNAWIFGKNIVTEMGDIRKLLGVCPQFDILFPDLTAEEHIDLFCGIKGINMEQTKGVVESRLKQLKLYNVRHQVSSTYSGGMKRRLSVILSCLGDPDCIFMDEPTTGMDPVNKRHVWSFIEKFKKGRVIILTTHSMEEADVLGDRIAIMARGRLKGIGKAIRLKNKFGTGYRISIIAKSQNVPSVKKLVEGTTSAAKLEEEESLSKAVTETGAAGESSTSTTKLVYVVQEIADVKKLVNVLEQKQLGDLLSGKEHEFDSWGMSQTTLEDVFLKMIHD